MTIIFLREYLLASPAKSSTSTGALIDVMTLPYVFKVLASLSEYCAICNDQLTCTILLFVGMNFLAIEASYNGIITNEGWVSFDYDLVTTFAEETALGVQDVFLDTLCSLNHLKAELTNSEAFASVQLGVFSILCDTRVAF